MRLHFCNFRYYPGYEITRMKSMYIYKRRCPHVTYGLC